MLSRFIRAQRTQAMAGIPASTTIGIPAPIIMDTMMVSIMIGMETMTTSSTIDHAGGQMRRSHRRPVEPLRNPSGAVLRATKAHHAAIVGEAEIYRAGRATRDQSVYDRQKGLRLAGLPEG